MQIITCDTIISRKIYTETIQVLYIPPTRVFPAYVSSFPDSETLCQTNVIFLQKISDQWNLNYRPLSHVFLL
jgi:hypothetical protein